jgi:pimeloyl-ACP methyl ester carboxylesterase
VGPALFRLAFGRPGLVGVWLAATRQRRRFPLRRFWRSIAPANAVRWTRRIFFESMRDLPGRYALVQRTLAEVRVPTLVVWADHDPFFPVVQGERLARALSAARLVLLRDTGHFVPEEQPEALVASLRDHFQTATTSHGSSTTAPERPPTSFVRP